MSPYRGGLWGFCQTATSSIPDSNTKSGINDRSNRPTTTTLTYICRRKQSWSFTNENDRHTVCKEIIVNNTQKIVSLLFAAQNFYTYVYKFVELELFF